MTGKVSPVRKFHKNIKLGDPDDDEEAGGLSFSGEIMAKRSRHGSRKLRVARLRGHVVPVARVSAVGTAAIAVCIGCFYAFNAGSHPADSGIPETQLKRDLARRTADTADIPESESVNGAEPARLTVDAMTEAAPLQVTERPSGPLFDSQQFDSQQVDSRPAAQLAASRVIPIEWTRFRPTAVGRARANQAAWLTGNIESVQ